ncbi:NADH-FMN oxidoreductase RutF, flavin reductase (DIM6/NTAB) family [Sporanaerobacter acetigenes DSM 13106]|uniref:NADH-FMN oxidoreductase RutF, flavin reductase (DIM6/NTAB) family n=2 Tax=Sporanaerobacter acetigenes TaxID=165813 RepID=A0A1M5Z7I0_9FIRM|nr:NADH-FMN oxidoreductase RutF, flavin reductase (DIM6/NTAB) family [Sporanaerobacter acetigenes DSM 13106]
MVIIAHIAVLLLIVIIPFVQNVVRALNGLIALPSFPVVFITVENNIMVAAAFHFYSFEPPSVMVGIKPEKYTYELITSSKEFAINIPTKEQLDKIHICGSISGRHVDKYKEASLSPRKGNKINSFLIEECPVNIECQVVHQIDYDGSHKWFIGEIREVHIDENYIRDDALMFWLGQFRTVGEIIEGACNEELLKR